MVRRRRRLLLAAVAALVVVRILTGNARADVVPEPGSTSEPDEPRPPRLHGGAAFAVGGLAGAAFAAAIVGGLVWTRRRRRAAHDKGAAGDAKGDVLPETERSASIWSAPLWFTTAAALSLACALVTRQSLRRDDGAAADGGSGGQPPPSEDAGSPLPPPSLPPDPRTVPVPDCTGCGGPYRPPHAREIEAKDPRGVDFADLLPQALSLARTLAPDATLGRAELNPVTSGLIKVAGFPETKVHLGFRTTDPRGAVDVDLWNGLLVAAWSMASNAGPPKQPTCRSSAVWAALVAQGVAPNGNANFSFIQGDWFVRVPFHPWSEGGPFVVDSRTCAARSLIHPPKPATPPARPSPKATPRSRFLAGPAGERR